MDDNQATPQQQQNQTISAEGLQSFYAEFGAKTHALHEASAQLTQAKRLLEQARELYGPQSEAVAIHEPTPIKADQKKTGAGG